MNPPTWQKTTGFGDCFKAATGNAPYAYQCRLACGAPPPGANGDPGQPDETTRRWFATPDSDGCRSRLVTIPTGLGETVTVVLAWLWNRVQVSSAECGIQKGLVVSFIACRRGRR